MQWASPEKLFVEFQFPITHRNVAAALRPYGITDFEFSLAMSGVKNATIIVEAPEGKHALRVYRQGKKVKSEIELELGFAEFVGEHGIPVAGVVRTTGGDRVAEFAVAGKTWQAVLMQFEHGHHPEGYTSYLLARMAGMQAHMHKLGVEFASQRGMMLSGAETLAPDSLVRTLDGQRLTDPRLVELLARAKALRVVLPAELERGFSHFDFVDGNLLVSASGRISSVLDFDDARYAPLVICLANTLWSILAATKGYDAARLYVQTYQQTRRLAPTELAVIKDLLLHRGYWICAMVVSFGSATASEMDHLLAMERKVQELPRLS
jgi:Ser/Thr protein kinase RdoA (MazF antagonist)